MCWWTTAPIWRRNTKVGCLHHTCLASSFGTTGRGLLLGTAGAVEKRAHVVPLSSILARRLFISPALLIEGILHYEEKSFVMIEATCSKDSCESFLACAVRQVCSWSWVGVSGDSIRVLFCPQQGSGCCRQRYRPSHGCPPVRTCVY